MKLIGLLDARLLHAFVAVAQERHFGRAAQRLHLSQPPVSQRIRQLEELLGVQLLLRSTRQVSLTPAGQELYRRAVLLIEEAAAAEAAVKRHATGEQGELRIGFTRTAASQLLPRLLAHYHESRPEVRLHMHEDWSGQLIELLLQEKLDVALLRHSMSDVRPGIQFTLVHHEPFCLAIPKTHRLARKRKVHPPDLNEETLVGYSAATARYFHERLDEIMTHYGIAADIRHQSAIPTVLALVNAGMGIALIPRSAASLRATNTVILPLQDTDNVANVELYAATRLRETSPLAMELVNTLLDLCQGTSASRQISSSPEIAVQA